MKLLILSFLLCTLLALSQAADETKNEPGMKEAVSEEKQDEALMEEIVSEEKQYEAVMEEVVSEGEKHDVVKRAACCPSGWARYRNRCFLYIGAKYTWAQAERYCVVYQRGNLASVHSSSEVNFLRSYIYSRTRGYPATWIGGSDAQQERYWFWSDGSRMKYSSFCSRMPRTNRSYNCMANIPSRRCSYDLPCSYRYVFVCARRLK